MSSRLVVVALLCSCAVDDVPVIEVSARAMLQVTLGPAEQEPVSEDDAAFRWLLVLAPATSTATSPEGASAATFTPDIRGSYVVERWLEYGLADELTHRFVVRAEGVPPIAVARAVQQAPVGMPVLLDGGESRSDEGRELIYRWRLAERPRDSAAVLTATQTSSSSFLPDRTGEYRIALTVFDGELWNVAPAGITVVAQ